MSYETISETVEAYNETIDFEGPVSVAGMGFWPSAILSELDPIAYKCGWIGWCDAEGIDTDELEDDYTFERDRW